MADFSGFFEKYKALILDEAKKNSLIKNKIMAMYVATLVISPVVEKIRFETLDSEHEPLSGDLKKQLKTASQQCLGYTHHMDIDRSTQKILSKIGQKMANEDLSFIEDLNADLTDYFGKDLDRLKGIFESCKVKALADMTTS
jgi:hypothetical protein